MVLGEDLGDLQALLKGQPPHPLLVFLLLSLIRPLYSQSHNQAPNKIFLTLKKQDSIGPKSQNLWFQVNPQQLRHPSSLQGITGPSPDKIAQPGPIPSPI